MLYRKQCARCRKSHMSYWQVNRTILQLILLPSDALDHQVRLACSCSIGHSHSRMTEVMEWKEPKGLGSFYPHFLPYPSSQASKAIYSHCLHLSQVYSFSLDSLWSGLLLLIPWNISTSALWSLLSPSFHTYYY